MKPYIIGKKIGMTQLFLTDGTVVPVTVIETYKGVVTQVKTMAKDGYMAAQIGFGDGAKLNKAQTGHFKATETKPKIVSEIRIDEEDQKVKVGAKVDSTSFTEIKQVEISAVSKGKGFAGVIKRHHFSRGPETHGSDHHRAPGSIGGMFPQRVLKGQKLPGHMGHVRTTVKKLELVAVDTKNNLFSIRGSVPGPKGGTVEITGIMQ
ncbi:MAG: 50S ribosomal protein L3 [Patescibacteria group bacterium]|jgi:large subunit ribosomal protein L3